MKVFVSSTFIDLERHRSAVEEILKRMGETFEGMEYLGSRPSEPKEVCLEEIRKCDVFVGIYAHRYGWIPKGDKLSITEQEYDFAVGEGKACYCYIVDPNYEWSPTQIERGEAERKLERFKRKVGRFVNDQFRSPDDLAKKVSADLRRASTRHAEKLNETELAQHLDFCSTELQRIPRPFGLRTLDLPPLFVRPASNRALRDMKISDATKQFPRLLILGEPGAGKTSALKELARDEADRLRRCKQARWEASDRLPILVNLAEYPGMRRDHGSHVLERLICTGVQGVSPEAVAALLAAGRCLLLIDGLNEVGQVYQDVICDIRELLRKSPANRVVVTCRAGMYGQELVDVLDTVELEPLTQSSAYRVLERECGQTKAQAAWYSLDAYTRDFCRNPLMLTLLADELQREGKPPRNRAELIGRFIDRYLNEWAGLRGAGSVNVEKEILSALAGELGTSLTLLSVDGAVAAMSRRLGELQKRGIAEASADITTLNEQFLKHGLLRETGGQTGFFHQAIQEFFLAREIATNRGTDYMLERVPENDWAETLVFVSGFVDDATSVVREVIRYGDLYLATRCTLQAKDVQGHVVDELMARLIGNVKEKTDRGMWFGKVRRDMLAILSLEPKTQTERLSRLFAAAYDADSRASYDLAHVLLFNGFSEQAVALLKPLVDANPNDASLRGLLAWGLRDERDFDGSLAQFNKCLKKAPEQGRVWVDLGVTLERMIECDAYIDDAHDGLREFRTPRACFDHAIEVEPRLSYAHYHYGLTLIGESPDQAKACFRRALDLDPQDPRPRIALARICCDLQNDPAQAILEYEQALRLDADPAVMEEAVFGLARALQSAGRFEESSEWYQNYLDRYPWGEYSEAADTALTQLRLSHRVFPSQAASNHEG